MKKNINILIIGCGFFSQNIYIPISILNFYKQNIFLYDERKKLKIETAKYFNCNYLNNLDKKTLNKKGIKICILCFERSKSFNYSKTILSSNINLFAEKPVCSSSKGLKQLLILAKKNKVFFQSSFQRRFDYKLMNFKKIVRNFRNRLFTLKCNFYSGNFRFNKKTKIRTKEKIKNINNFKSKDKISFLIFLNRYWHIINAINLLFPFAKKIKDIRNIDFKFYDRTNYILKFSYKNRNFNLTMNSKKNKGWFEKYELLLEKRKNFSVKLLAPMKFNSKYIHKTSFYKQFIGFLINLNTLNYNNIETSIDELSFIEKIWEKKYLG